VWENFAVLILCFVLLRSVCKKIIEYTEKIASVWGMGHMAAGFILLSISTSLPEFFISILSSIQGQSSISVGNVLGANIADITFVLGVTVLITGKKVVVVREEILELIRFLFIPSLITVLILQGGTLTWNHGLVLLALFGYFVVDMSRRTKNVVEIPTARPKKEPILLVKFALYAAVLLVIAHFIVDAAVAISVGFGIIPSVVGATVVSVGTTLPELSTGIVAMRKGHYSMALGDIIGSCIVNITLVLGIASLLSQRPFDLLSVSGLVFFFLLTTMSLWYMLDTSNSLDRKEAYILIFLYILFMLQELGISLVYLIL
jgi:cation:H+ antiporter